MIASLIGMFFMAFFWFPVRLYPLVVVLVLSLSNGLYITSELTTHLSVLHPDLSLIPKHPIDPPFLSLTDSSKLFESTSRIPSSTLKISASGMRIGFWIGIMIPTRCLTMTCESSSLFFYHFVFVFVPPHFHSNFFPYLF